MEKILASKVVRTLSFTIAPLNHVLDSTVEMGFNNSQLYLGPIIDSEFTVLLNGNEYKPVIQDSGLLAFMDIGEYDSYTVTLESDKFVVFCDKDSQSPYDEIVIDSSDRDPMLPNFNYIMKPSYDYYFESSITLIRGTVVNEDGMAQKSALIKERDNDNYTITDSNGRFALYFLNFGDNQKNIKYTIEKDSNSYDGSIDLNPGDQVDLGILTIATINSNKNKSKRKK